MPRAFAPVLVRTSSQLERVVEEFSQFDTLVVDVETTMLGPYTNEILWIGLGVPGRVALIPLQHPNGRLLVPVHEETVLPPWEERKILTTKDPVTGDFKRSVAKRKVRVGPVFGPPGQQLWADAAFKVLEPLLFSDVTKIGHNLKFDLLSMKKYFGAVPPGPYEDTIILAHVVNEERLSFGLKELTGDWLKLDAKRRQAYYPSLGSKGVQNFGLDQVARYLTQDIRFCWYLRNLFWEQIQRHHLERVVEIEMSLYPVLMNMESVGFPVDLGQLGEKKVLLEAQISEIEQECWSIVGRQFPLTNTGEKRRALFDAVSDGGQGLAPLTVTPKEGLPSVTAAVLDYYADRNEVARLFKEFAEAEKIRGTFIEGLRSHAGADGRIHTSFKQHGTVTGRLCVDPETLIEMPRDLRRYPDGVPLREVSVGDWVYSFDWHKNLCLRQVTWVGSTKVSETVDIEILDKKTGVATMLRASPGHLVRMFDGDWRPVGMLKPGERLMGMVRRGVDEGYEAMKRSNHTVVSISPGPVQQLWDLEVEGTHSFVGAGVALHNSASEPNLQQLPRGSVIREMFVAPEGETLIVADYDQVELRVAAELSGDEGMRRAFQVGDDVHKLAAAAMFRVHPESVTDLQRAVGKTQNFAVLYGASPDRVASVARVSRKTAEVFIRRYYEQFSMIQPWKEKLLQEVRESGDPGDLRRSPPFVQIPPVGRRRRLPALYSMDRGERFRAERQAVNALVQGFASYILKLAMIEMHQQFQGYPAAMLVTVHDELVVCTADSNVGATATLVKRVMESVTYRGRPIFKHVPLVASVGKGHSWAAAKGK
jgi:DNA polymerase I-like protein with 3'-5' exonuclease and polymerase domains